jgi:hypothetical protein
MELHMGGLPMLLCWFLGWLPEVDPLNSSEKWAEALLGPLPPGIHLLS